MESEKDCIVKITHSNSRFTGSGIVTIADDKQFIVERILGKRVIRSDQQPLPPSSYSNNSSKKTYHYFIKWKGKSYLHCSWELIEDIEKVDPQGKAKLIKYDFTNPIVEDSIPFEYFDPDLAIPQRILACSNKSSIFSDIISFDTFLQIMNEHKSKISSIDSENNTLYLVKWRSLLYTESTWERYDDLFDFPQVLFEYWIRNNPEKPLLSQISSESLTNNNSTDTITPITDIVRSCDFGQYEGFPLKFREYQMEGVSWMLENHKNQQTCVLNDETGLGKSVQITCFLKLLFEMKCNNPFQPALIICNSTNINHWLTTFEQWAPNISITILTGKEKERDLIKQTDFSYSNHEQYENDFKFDVLLTHFDIITRESDFLTSTNWTSVIVDDAYKVKNAATKLHIQLSKIPSNQYIFIANFQIQKAEDLWSLIIFSKMQRNVYPTVDYYKNQFNTIQSLNDEYSGIKHESLLRRTHLLSSLKNIFPTISNYIVHIPLTSCQIKVMKSLYQLSTPMLQGVTSFSESDKLLLYNELINCCGHPSLVQIRTKLKDTQEMSVFESSSKVKLLYYLLPKLIEQKKKIILCTQYISIIEILESYLHHYHYLFERLDATMKSTDQIIASERYNRTYYERSIILVSLQENYSLVQGIDLSCADTLILFDCDPNYDVSWLMNSYKIAMRKPLHVYRLVCENSIEACIYRHVSRPLDESNNSSNCSKSKPLTTAEILKKLKVVDIILREVAYLLFPPASSSSSAIAGGAEESSTTSTPSPAATMTTADSLDFAEKVTELLSRVNSTNTTNSSSTSALSGECIDTDLLSSALFWHTLEGLRENEDEAGAVLTGGHLKISRKRKISSSTESGTTAAGGVTANGTDIAEKTKKKKKAKMTKNNSSTSLLDHGDVTAVLGDTADDVPLFRTIKGVKSGGGGDSTGHFEWTGKLRDKAISSLLCFGFGRWQRIMAHINCKSLNKVALEELCKAYILKCGLAASEMPFVNSAESDTIFIQEAIEASLKLKSIEDSSGKSVVKCSDILKDDSFLARLKGKGGSAKRALNVLGVLAKLESFVMRACRETYKKQGRPRDPNLGADLLFEGLDIQDLCDTMQIDFKRPKFLQRVLWWDDTITKHFIIGAFKHGYGRIDLIKKDPNLAFKGILDQIKVDKAEFGPNIEGQVGVVNIVQDVSEEHKDGSLSLERDQVTSIGGADVATSTGVSPACNDVSSDVVHTSTLLDLLSVPVNTATSTSAGSGIDMLLGTGTEEQTAVLGMIEGGGGEDDQDEADDMGEEEDARLRALEAAGDGMPETRFLNKLLGMLVAPDVFGATAVRKKREPGSKRPLHAPAPTPTPTTSSSASSSSKVLAPPVPTASSSLSSSSIARVPKVSPEEISLLTHLDEFIDTAAMQGAAFIKLTQYCVTSLSRETMSNVRTRRTETEDGSAVRISLEEEEILRITSALCLFGAPLVLDKSLMTGKNAEAYDWVQFVHVTKVHLDPKHIRHFYESCWIPFCYRISDRNIVFTSKRKIPNPLLKPSEHSIESRGLCHQFLLRQKRLRMIHYILTESLETLRKYLSEFHGDNERAELGPWWQTPLHDYALLTGCLSFGYMAIEMMRATPGHPFHQETLLHMNAHLTHEQTDSFPTYSAIELRLVDILSNLTPVNGGHGAVMYSHAHLPNDDNHVVAGEDSL